MPKTKLKDSLSRCKQVSSAAGELCPIAWGCSTFAETFYYCYSNEIKVIMLFLFIICLECK